MLGEEEDGCTVKEMLSRWLDTLRNGPRPERMNFRMHRFSIIERSTDPSAGTITSFSMHSRRALSARILALSDKLQTRGRDPFFFLFFLAHLGYFFSSKKVLRGD